jgi:hypothetical protein
LLVHGWHHPTCSHAERHDTHRNRFVVARVLFGGAFLLVWHARERCKHEVPDGFSIRGGASRFLEISRRDHALCRGHVSDANRQTLLGQGVVQTPRTVVPEFIEILVKLPKLGRLQSPQKLVHRSHHTWMRVEGAACKADVAGDGRTGSVS